MRFKKYDFMNVPTSLGYKNEYFYATNIGAALTVIFCFIIITLISYEIIILYKKSSFTLIYNQYTDLLQTIDFSETPILFQMTNSNNKIMELDKKLFELVAYNMEGSITKYANGTTKRKVTNTIVELEKCDKIYSNQSEYSELNLSNYICIKPGQNMTAFGLLGDKINPYKGLRIYINKCSGPDCYNDSVITKQFHNAKFYLHYLSLSSNMFDLNSNDLKFQLFTKFFSFSTNVLKKIVFTFDLGQFHLYNNILFRNSVSFNYLLGNEYTLDVDIDQTSTLKGDENTIAYVSFHYGGRIIETRKEVQTIFESLTIIGNIVNIILTIFKVINSYYSNKILFADIFNNVFFAKEKLNFHFRNNFNNFHLNNSVHLNKKNSPNKKKNLDESAQICFNNNNNANNNINIIINKNNSIKQINNKMVIKTGKKLIMPKRKSKTFFEKKENISKGKLLYYYILPLWLLKRNKNLKSFYLIKDRICGYFSIEKINELIRFKENLEEKSFRSKMKSIESIKINSNYEKTSLDDESRNNKNKNVKTLN